MRSTLFSQPINDRIIRLYNNREEKFERDFRIDSFLSFLLSDIWWKLGSKYDAFERMKYSMDKVLHTS